MINISQQSISFKRNFGRLESILLKWIWSEMEWWFPAKILVLFNFYWNFFKFSWRIWWPIKNLCLLQIWIVIQCSGLVLRVFFRKTSRDVLCNVWNAQIRVYIILSTKAIDNWRVFSLALFTNRISFGASSSPWNIPNMTHNWLANRKTPRKT